MSFGAVRRVRCLVGSACFAIRDGRSIRSNHEQISKHEGRIGNVQICALADGLFHSIGEVAKSTCHPLTGHRDNRSEAVLLTTISTLFVFNPPRIVASARLRMSRQIRAVVGAPSSLP